MQLLAGVQSQMTEGLKRQGEPHMAALFLGKDFARVYLEEEEGRTPIPR